MKGSLYAASRPLIVHFEQPYGEINNSAKSAQLITKQLQLARRCPVPDQSVRGRPLAKESMGVPTTWFVPLGAQTVLPLAQEEQAWLRFCGRETLGKVECGRI
jgi:hypothetical protein